MNTCKILCYAVALQLALGLTLASAQAPTPGLTSIYAPKVELTWKFPEAEEKYITGFRIYLGKKPKDDVTYPPVEDGDPGPYDKVFAVGPTQRNIVLDLEPGEYFFNVATFGDVDGKPAVSRFTEELQALRELAGVKDLQGVMKYFEVPIK